LLSEIVTAFRARTAQVAEKTTTIKERVRVRERRLDDITLLSDVQRDVGAQSEL
jgi:hypothetical protein